MAKSKVAVLKVTPHSVLSDIEHLCELADMSRALDQRASTILKDDLSWHYPFPSANTTPWQLEGAVLALRQAGFSELSCVQNHTLVTDAFRAEGSSHYQPVFSRHALPVLSSSSDEEMNWAEYRPRARLRALHEVFPEGLRIPSYFMGKNVVHLPTMKWHMYTTTAGAMSNAFAGLLGPNRHYAHSWIHRSLVDVLAIQREIQTGLFAIMDGTMAGNGPGPRTMYPVTKDYMLASADQVAVDAVAAKMMGFDPMSIEYINLAHTDGLGVGDPREIEVVGADISSESWGFQVGDNAASKVGDLLWFSPLKHAQKLFFHTPLVKLFALGSAAYHDYYRWPRKERRVFEDWKHESEWGKLFEAYAGNTEPAAAERPAPSGLT